MAEDRVYSYEEGQIVLKTRMVTHYIISIGLLSLAGLAVLGLVLYDIFLGGGWLGTITSIAIGVTLVPAGAILFAKARGENQALKFLKKLGT